MTTRDSSDLESLAQIIARLEEYNRGKAMDTVKRPSIELGRINPWYVAAALVATVDVVLWWLALRQGFTLPAEAMDLVTYRTAAQSWLDGTGFYQPYQLVGPYGLGPQPILYPPSAIPLFAAFTVLPAFLWWAVPLGVLAWKAVGPFTPRTGSAPVASGRWSC